VAPGQAFAVAFGLAFLILGGGYVMVRSHQEAERHRENRDAPQSTIWLFVDRGFTVLFVSGALYLGTSGLIDGWPNFFIAAGLSTLLYVQALKRAFGLNPSVLRIMCSAYVLAGVLSGIGSALYGGRLGTLGAILSVAWAATWLSISKAIWRVEKVRN
jgi:hypothetical protein